MRVSLSGLFSLLAITPEPPIGLAFFTSSYVLCTRTFFQGSLHLKFRLVAQKIKLQS